ncbi:MAG: TonB-dependent receptor plug domain-containing protein [Tannerella sp.]|jgi:outer membrane receptor protein involved in Fe transport|nr:TonB-dependent receptor plug domain-containing protein [Tannerella sp.]
MRYVLVLFICILQTGGGAAAVAQQRTGQALVKGRVRTADGHPAAYVAVFLQNTQYGAVTDEEGAFQFHAPAGQYTLATSLLGYESRSRAVTLGAGRSATVDFVISEVQHELGEVTVTGKSKVQLVNESAFNVVSVDAQALHNTTLSLTHALDRISGVKIRETGGVGSNTQVSLNGFSGRHVKIFLDGVPMEGFGSAFQINNMPVNFAERIEVYKGVVPVELGADALGGAINIISRQTGNTWLDAAYSYGSFNTHKSNVSFGHTAPGGFTVMLNAYQNYSDNNYRVKTRLLNLETNNYSQEDFWFERFHDNYHNEAVAVKAGFVNRPFADRLLLGLTLSREKADIQNANLMKIVYGGRERRAQSVIPTLNYEKRNLFVPNLRLAVTMTANSVRNNNIDTLARQYNWNREYRVKGAKGEGLYSMSEYDNRNAYVTANLGYKFAEHHSIALNNQYSRFVRQATDAAANGENSTAATFMRRTNAKNVLGASYRFEIDRRLNVSVFGKFYDVSVRGPINVETGSTTSVYEEQQRDYRTSGYGAAATWFPLASLQLKASFEKACRLPSENELFGDESLETGDASLKPESSRNVNLNVSFSSDFDGAHSLYLDAGFIYRDTRDYIRRRIEQRYGGAYYVNHGKVRNVGFDCEARYFYGKAFSAGGNFTWQNIRNMERYDVGGRELIYYRDRMPNVPYMLGSADAGYNLYGLLGRGSRLSFGYNLRYVHSFFRDWESEGGDIVIPGQLSHDVNIACAFEDGRYNVALEVNNVADEIMYDNYSLQKPGRSISVKFRYFLFKNRL